MRDLNPEWKTFSVSMEEFCGGDAAAEVTAEVWDWDRVTDDFIGSATLTLDTAKPGASWPLNNPKKMPGGGEGKEGLRELGHPQNRRVQRQGNSTVDCGRNQGVYLSVAHTCLADEVALSSNKYSKPNPKIGVDQIHQRRLDVADRGFEYFSILKPWIVCRLVRRWRPACVYVHCRP